MGELAFIEQNHVNFDNWFACYSSHTQYNLSTLPWITKLNRRILLKTSGKYVTTGTSFLFLIELT